MVESTSPKIRAIQARNYRCLRHIDVRLDADFYVVIGPNGSGKSTLFDAIEFVFGLFHQGLRSTIASRTRNFQDLVWGRPKKDDLWLELGAEFEVGDEKFRYEVKIAEVAGRGIQIVEESGYIGWLNDSQFSEVASTDSVFCKLPSNALKPTFRRAWDPRADEYVTTFFLETNNVAIPVSYTHDASAIRLVEIVEGLPATEGTKERTAIGMPIAKEVAEALVSRRTVQFLQLDSRALRKPSARNGDDGTLLEEDGSNLPRVVANLAADEEQWHQWQEHIREALPNVESIRMVHREEERSDYLMIRYSNGVEVPSWGISEGTLRLLALTILAYVQNGQPATYLVEEPENGIHPMAVELAYQSLSSVYHSQVFIASHSPTFLRCVEPNEVLCFSREKDGSTVITKGDEHPALSKWRGSVEDDLFFAPDILGS